MPSGSSRIRLIRTHIDRFDRSLRGIERGDASALHRARVATRRLRELVPLLQLSGTAAHKLSRRLRTVTERLGAVREFDVLLGVVDELHAERRASSDALARVGMAIARDRDAARARLFERLPTAQMRRLSRRLRSLADDLEEERADHARAVRWAVDARVARRAARLADAMRDAGAVYLPERLHAVRIAAKKMRYVLEVAGNVADTHVHEDVARLTRVQDALGRMHDLQVLVDRVRSVQATLAPPSVAVWRALDDDCRRLHARYMKARPALEALVDRLSGRGSRVPGNGLKARGAAGAKSARSGPRNPEPGARNPDRRAAG